MRTLLMAIALALPCSVAAQVCGPQVDHSFKTVRSEQPAKPAASAGLVYFIQAGEWTGSFAKISDNRSWIGITRRNTYFAVSLEHGEHDICSTTGGMTFNPWGRSNAKVVPSPIHLRLTVEPGSVHYLLLNAYSDSLTEISEDDAAALLKKCKRTIFWEKGKPEPAVASLER